MLTYTKLRTCSRSRRRKRRDLRRTQLHKKAVFRNFYNSRNGRGFYADDGTLQGNNKLFLMHYVTDLEVIADDTDDEDVSFSQSVREQIARLDRLRAEMDTFMAKLDALKRALDDSDQGGRRVRRRL